MQVSSAPTRIECPVNTWCLPSFDASHFVVFFPALVSFSPSLSCIHVVGTSNQYCSLMFESLVMDQFVLVLT
jgi:hypothetical protein